MLPILNIYIGKQDEAILIDKFHKFWPIYILLRSSRFFILTQISGKKRNFYSLFQEFYYENIFSGYFYHDIVYMILNLKRKTQKIR